MALVIPDGWENLPETGPAQRELTTLALLAAQLPDDYTVYHAVHWTNLEQAHAIHGQIDFVVVNRSGDLLVIEQKSGFLEETDKGLVKHQGGRTHWVAVQMSQTVRGLTAKLARSLNGQVVRMESLLYCPDHFVKQPLSAGLSPENVVDASRRDALPAAIEALLPAGQEAPLAERVHRFLRDIIQLETDVSALIGEANTLVTRVAGGLAHWARSIEMEPFRLRVIGTAGSGKTQLALAEYRDAVERGKRPLYVCFNRPLADHFARIAPLGGQATTLHMLCDQVLRDAGQIPDFSAPDAFRRLLVDAAAVPVPQALRFDTIIIDEGQDFAPAWAELVLRHALPEARMLWLEDPMQTLYEHPPVDLPGWVRLKANTNFRSPRPVVRWLQPLLAEGVEIEAAAPISTAEVELLTYTDQTQLVHAVTTGIRQCYSAGFRKSDVALLSYRGREHSQLLKSAHLGPHTLRSFTGAYDLLGQPLYSSGDILAESIYRFKGQSAPAVVFAEIDFETLDPREVRKLFVGATRATLKLVLVLSERSAAALGALT